MAHELLQWQVHPKKRKGSSRHHQLSYSIAFLSLKTADMTRLANTAYHNKYSDTVKAMPNITVFFLQASRSIRTVWLLEELNVPYDIKFADRVNQKAPQDFKESSGSPLGKFPCIQDGDLTVHESGAITE